MAYQAKVVYTRPSTDVEWFQFRTDLEPSAAEIDRMTKTMELIESKANEITVKVEFSSDNLVLSYIHEFADEAAYNVFKAEWDTFVVEQLDGIAPSEDATITQWKNDTGCTIAIEYATV